MSNQREDVSELFPYHEGQEGSADPAKELENKGRGGRPVPEATEDEIRRKVDEGISILGPVIKAQFSESLEDLKEASEEYAIQGAKVVEKISDLGEMVVAGKISPESAESAMNNYIHALELYRHTLTNKAKIEAYQKGREILFMSGKVVFSLIRIGIKVAAPSIGVILK